MSASPHAEAEPNGPVVQSLRIGFDALGVVILLLAAIWLTGNIRRVPPDAQAVVERFGRIIRTQQAGLLLAWPQPIERVVLLPGAARQNSLAIDVRALPTSAATSYDSEPSEAASPATASAYLTGDGGVVLLDATLAWHVSDAAAYLLAEDHVAPALRRLFLASAVALTAGRDLDALLVARPEAAAVPARQSARAALGSDLATAVNTRLAALAKAGAPLGVEVSRVDVTAALPPAVRRAFESVLTAGQVADRGIADARTQATRTQQSAARTHDSLLAAAQAAAVERIAAARTATAPIDALEARLTPATRAGLIAQAYRDRVATLLPTVGQVTAIDAKAGTRLILPGVTDTK